MQIVGDKLPDMSDPIFWDNLENYFKMASVKNFTQHAKH